MAEEVSLATAINSVIEHAIAKVFVSRPAQVLAYDATTQKVDVEVAIAETIETDDGNEDLPLASIYGVPVMFPRGGGFFLSVPIAVGDYVTLVFADRSIDLWLKNGGANVNPIDLRRHSIGDAVAIPGGYPDPKVLTEASADRLVLGKDGGMQLSIDDTGAAVLAAVGAATQAVALADDTRAELDLIKADFDSLVSAVNLHMHPTAAVGPPSVPTPPIVFVPHTPGSVGSGKCEVEE